MSQINLTSPSSFTSAVLIGDMGSSTLTNASPDSIPSLTQVGGLPVAVCCEFQSTLGAVLFPRMTTAQIAALGVANVSSVTNGMQAFNTNTQSMNVYQNGAWANTGSVQMATGSLTLAQFLATNSASPTILAAPGAGFINYIHQFELQMTYGSAQLVGGDAIGLYYSTGPSLATTTIAAATLQGVTASTIFGIGPALTGGITTANSANASVILRNPTADFTVGTGATFTYKIWYSVISSP